MTESGGDSERRSLSLASSSRSSTDKLSSVTKECLVLLVASAR